MQLAAPSAEIPATELVEAVAEGTTAPDQVAAGEPVSIGKFKLPFGTFLAASAIFVLFAGNAVLSWYASLFRF